MKKKTVSILLMAAMALSLAACGFSNSTDSSSKSSSKAESTSASSASSEAESASRTESTADGEVFDDTTVTVFAAKSLNSVMETLISEYNKTQPNVKLVGSYDSSGTLMTQIEEGHPATYSSPQQQNRWISLRKRIFWLREPVTTS